MHLIISMSVDAMPPNAGGDMEKLYCSYTVMGLGSGRARPQNLVYFKSIALRRQS